MKKKEILLIFLLTFFGFVYHLVHNQDFGFLKKSSLFFVSTRLQYESFFEFFSGTDTFHEIKSLEIENEAGSVYIERTEGENLIFSSIVRIYHKNDYKAKKILKKIFIKKNIYHNCLKISIASKGVFPYHQARIEIRIKVPLGVKVKVTNSFGNIFLKGIEKDVYIKEFSGDVTLVDVKSAVAIECIHANVNLFKIDGKVKMISKFSHINMEDIRHLEIDNYYGTAKLKNIQNAQLKLIFTNTVLENLKRVEVFSKNSDLFARNIDDYFKLRLLNGKASLYSIRNELYIEGSNCKIDIDECELTNAFIRNLNSFVVLKRIKANALNMILIHGSTNLDLLELTESFFIDSFYSNIAIRFRSKKPLSALIKNEYGQFENISDLKLKQCRSGKHSFFSKECFFPRLVINSYYGKISLDN